MLYILCLFSLLGTVTVLSDDRCFVPQNPFFIGGSVGSTQINAIDIFSNNQMVVGGVSASTDLVSASGNSFVKMSSLDKLDTWMKELPLTSLVAVKFSPDGSRVLVLCGSSTTQVSVTFLDATDGALLSSQVLTVASSPIKGSMTHDTVIYQSGYILIGIATNESPKKYRIMKFPDSLTPPVSSTVSRYSASSAILYSMVQDPDQGTIFAATDIYISYTYAGVIAFDESTLSVVWDKCFKASYDLYEIRRIAFAKDPYLNKNVVAGCLETNTDVSTLVNPYGGSLGFFVIFTNPTTNAVTSTIVGTDQNNEFSPFCEKLYVKPGSSTSKIYAYVSSISALTGYRSLRLDVVTYSSSSVSSMVYNSQPLLYNQITDAYFVNENLSYYVGKKQEGTVDNWDLFSQSLPKPSGYIMSFTSSHSDICLSTVDLISDPATLTTNSYVSFTQTFSLTFTSDTPVLNSNAISVIDKPSIPQVVPAGFCVTSTVVMTDNNVVTTYEYQQGTQPLTITSDVTVQGLCSDTIWKYEAFLMTGSTPGPLPSFINQVNNILTISGNPSLGTYKVKMKTSVQNLQFVETLFTINVVNYCQTAILNYPSTLPAFVSYDIQSGAEQSIGTLLGWTSSYTSPQCPFTFKLLDPATNTELPLGSIFSLDTDDALVMTSSYADVNIYSVKIRYGYLTLKYIDFTVSVNVFDSCSSAVMTTTYPTDQVFYYNVDTTTETQLFKPSWECSISYCEPLFQFSFQDVATSLPADPNFLFDPLLDQVTIGIVDPIHIATNAHNVELVASYQTNIFSLPFNVIADTCANMVINTQTLGSIDYVIGSGKKTYQVTPFTVSNLGQPCDVAQTIVLSGPFDITFDQSLHQINIDSSSLLQFGNHTFTFTFKRGSETFSTNLKVNMLQPPNTPPQYASKLKDLTVNCSMTTTYELPGLKDSEGDSVSELVQMIGISSQFVQYSNHKLIIKPNEHHVGEHQVSIVLQDNNVFNQMATAYLLNITVVCEIPDNQNTTNNHTNQTDIPSTTPNTTQNNQTQQTPNNNTQLPQTRSTTSLTARITSVNSKGQLVVTFSKELVVPPSYKAFDTGVLDIYVKSEDITDPKYLSLSWIMQDFTSTTMKIQLFFDYPLYISQSFNFDTIYLKFKASDYFVLKHQKRLLSDQKVLLTIEQNYTLSKSIPTQTVSSQETMQTMESVGGLIQSGSTAVVATNLAVNLALSGSLQFLWGMINVQQLVMNLPLFNVRFPANTVYMYSILIQISSFDILPTDTIQGWFFTFTDSEPYSPEFDELDIFNKMQIVENIYTQLSLRYSTQNLIQNLGTVFYTVVIILIGMIVILLWRRFLNRYKWGKWIYVKVSDILFFNAILRSLIEGYLDFTLDSLLNLYSLNYDTISETISSILSIFMGVVLLTFPLAILLFLLAYQRRLEEEKFEKRAGALFGEQRTTSKVALMYHVFFVVRRLLYGIQAICLREYPFLQVQLLILQNFSIITYIYCGKPFKDPFLNKLEIFNECCLLLITYHMFVFSNLVPDAELRYNAGWSAIGITIFNISVNIIIVLVQGVAGIIEKIKQLKAKWKMLRLRRIQNKISDCSAHIDTQANNELVKGDDDSIQKIDLDGEIQIDLERLRKHQIRRSKEHKIIKKQELNRAITSLAYFNNTDRMNPDNTGMRETRLGSDDYMAHNEDILSSYNNLSPLFKTFSIVKQQK